VMQGAFNPQNGDRYLGGPLTAERLQVSRT